MGRVLLLVGAAPKEIAAIKSEHKGVSL